jgi:glycosyltransferase involved in cell wall biosynthesis
MDGRLCIFPNDPLDFYYGKGEIKERYFNPENLFDEIHIITLADMDIAEEMVQTMAGNAKLKIHTVGKINLSNYYFAKKRILQLVMEIKPNVIRTYNPLIAGWLGAYCAKKLSIPLVVSLHGNYDRDNRYQTRKNGDYSTYLGLILTSWFIEPYVLKNADRVICIYNSIVSYARKYGAKNIELVYNRVDLSRFSTNTAKELVFDKPVIISVGRLIREKNQECLIHAIKGLDVYLLLIGDGPLYGYLQELAKRLGVDKNVVFLRSVPHSEIHKYYTSADIFALPIKYGGFAIPVLEAMASGLPVIIPRREPGEKPEIIDDAVILVENIPEAFRNAFQQLLSDPTLVTGMRRIGLEKVRILDGTTMERKEADIYRSLVNFVKKQ